MTQMKTLLGLLLASSAAFCTPTWTCTNDSTGAIPCSSSVFQLDHGPTIMQLSIGGNSIYGQYNFGYGYDTTAPTIDPTGTPESMTFSDSGTVVLPKAAPGDYYVGWFDYGWGQGPNGNPFQATAYEDTFGPMTGISPGNNPDSHTVPDTTPTIPANQFTQINWSATVIGHYDPSYDIAPYGDAGGTIIFQLERFHADGTPDNFTPEPASLALTIGGLASFALLSRRRVKP
jgi:hypothetical protein